VAAFEVAFFLACAAVALVFLAACARLDARHAGWTLLVAVFVTGLALGLGVHVVAVRIARAV
jgi:hypothetical protein